MGELIVPVRAVPDQAADVRPFAIKVDGGFEAEARSA